MTFTIGNRMRRIEALETKAKPFQAKSSVLIKRRFDESQESAIARHEAVHGPVTKSEDVTLVFLVSAPASNRYQGSVQ